MATSIPHLQKSFKLSMKDGLPQAAVETSGGVQWVKCCPLCGSMHQIMAGTDMSAPYSPLCQTQPILFKAELAAWKKQNPDTDKYEQVRLAG
ncbi:MAG: hypothetical protein JNM70_09910 [Anaerolineae bacterium]|nr:hypothetical protein [Anaerolineae bacterium]